MGIKMNLPKHEYEQYIVYLRGIAADMDEELKGFEKFIRAEMKKEEKRNKNKDVGS